MITDLVKIVERFGQPRVLVLGDIMLDRYVWGDAERISQEAPVILLRADKRDERLGGGGSVAMMLRALGARVSAFGVVGADENGKQVRRILSDLDIEHEGVLADSDRPTTVKERYIGRAQHRHPQQMLRVDYEKCDALSPSLECQIKQFITSRLRQADIVLISDYDKGVCTPTLLEHIIAQSKELGIRVLVDPYRRTDYAKYTGCSAMTPNRLEAGQATNRQVKTTVDGIAVAQTLLDDLKMEAGIVTMDKDGMALAHSDGRREVLPTRPRQVYDIAGAGDMVLSVLGMALAAGADYADAIRIANTAGGLEVEKVGVAPVTRDEILHDLATAGVVRRQIKEKTLDLPELMEAVAVARMKGRKICFTNGCFDILHAGHVEYLREAKAQGDLLIVGLNSDASVQALKGPGRPINCESARATVLVALESVDHVTVFDAATPIDLIHQIRPDVLVKGADYRKDQVSGAEFVESYGGRVYLAPLKEGFSTTGIARKLVA